MDFGYLIGWVGVGFGVAVPIPQLLKIRRTGRVNDISIKTYMFLVCAIACYLAHAIYINSTVFTVAQSINITINTAILVHLWRGRYKVETSTR